MGRGRNLFIMRDKEWQEEKKRRLQKLIDSGELKQTVLTHLWEVKLDNIQYTYGNGYANPNKVVSQRMRREREKAGVVKTNIFVGDRRAWEKDKERILKPVTEIRYKPAKATPLKIYKIDEGIDWKDKSTVPYKSNVEPEPEILKPVFSIEPSICQQSNNLCKDCRRIFEDSCRFNNTNGFWRSR